MFRQSKATQMAVAAMSRLAEDYHHPERWLTAAEIARARHLPRPVIAKTLSVLARAGLICGSPGRGGGYRLARPPADISLLDVAVLFENSGKAVCPYGPQYCGTYAICPLHESLSAVHRLTEDYMRNMRLDLFTRCGPDPRYTDAQPPPIVPETPQRRSGAAGSVRRRR
jgi:Rrf2 family transcriptional regulator, iron-sulfur cluster assembly transcription factor